MKKKILSIILLAFLLLPVKTYAAGLGISASSKTIVNGNSVRITVSASGIAGRFSITSSNGKVLSGGAGSEWLENESKTYTFSSKGLGSATITVIPINAAYSDGSGKVTGSKSITINVVKPREKSTNNNLKSLSVEGYELNPSFSKDTLEYTVEVNDDKETIKINAEKEDGYASLAGDGEIEVAEGTNKLEVKVTSETGVEKVYTLNVNVKDSNPISKTVDGKEYTLVKRTKSLVLPDGVNKEAFKISTVKMDEVEIPSLVSEELNLTLIGLKDSNGAIYLYEYTDKIGSRYELLTNSGLTIKFKEPSNVLSDYTKTSIKIGEKEYTAYKYKKDYGYVLVYGTNTETNEDNWYQYNVKEKTLQIYNKDMIEDINNSFNSKLETYKLIIIGLSGISVLLLIIAIILGNRKGTSKKVKTEIKEVTDNDVVVDLENTKEIDKTEIIINKVEEKNKEDLVIPDKKKEIKTSTNSEFLNTEDLKEILEDNNIKEEKQKLTRKEKRKIKKGIIDDPDMALDFLDEKKRR